MINDIMIKKRKEERTKKDKIWEIGGIYKVLGVKNIVLG